MRIVTRIAEVRAEVSAARARNQRIGFVPTMGALHAGHLQLVTRARAEADLVVMSVFVNPLQFGPTEDLARYPRDPEGDARKAEDAGVDLLFMPPAAELYPRTPRVTVAAVGLGDRWEGALRPGHFAGVLTVVLKLLQVVQPDVAVFGQKDLQQATLVRAMADDLDVAVRIVVEPTVREADGLALSSRNRYLAAGDRHEAQRLHQALVSVGAAFAGGEHDSVALLARARAVLQREPRIETDYLDVVDAHTLEPTPVARPGDAVLLAARLGGTRLLDNMVLDGR